MSEGIKSGGGGYEERSWEGRWQALEGGEKEDEFAGEHVRGTAEGDIGFDMYPRQKGETPQEYGRRLRDMHGYAAMAREDGEKAEAKKAAEEYANSKLGKYEAYLRSRAGTAEEKRQGKVMYTNEEVDEMVATAKERFDDKERYAKFQDSLGDEYKAKMSDEGDGEGEGGEEGEVSIEQMREELAGENGLKFLSEQKAKGEGVMVTAEDVAEFSDGDLKKWYEKWKNELFTPEVEEGDKSPAEMRGEFLDGESGRKFLYENGVKTYKDLYGLSDERLKELYEQWKSALIEGGVEGEPEASEGEDEDEDEDEGEGEPKEPEDLTLAIVRNTEDEKIMAEDAAERLLREDLAKGGFLKKFVKGIWKGQMFKGYYLKKYEQQAYAEHFDKKGRRKGDLAIGDEENALIDRALSQYDEVRGKMETDTLPADHPATVAAKAAIEAFARGTMDKNAFKDEVGRIEAMLWDTGDKNAAQGEVVLGNYMKIAEAVKGRLAHDSGVENVMEGFTLVRAEAHKSINSEAHRDALDKITNYLERSKLGKLVPPAILAGAVGMAAWAGKSAASSLGKATGFLGGVAVAGGLAAIKERNRVTGDRAQMSRDIELGRTIGDTKYDKQMKETMYDMQSAADLTRELKEITEGGDGAKIMTALANIRMLDNLSARGEGKTIPLISFSSEDKRRQERLALDVAIAEAKVKVKGTRGNEGEDLNVVLDKYLLAEDGALRTVGEQIAKIDAKDKAFGKLRRKRMKTAALTTVGTMTAMAAAPLVGQEIRAAFSPKHYGLADKVFGLENNADAQLTTMANWLGIKNPNATFMETVTPAVGEYNRQLTAKEKADLEAQGYTVQETNTPVSRTEYETVERNPAEYAREHGTRVTRDGHANNGTKISDGNELGAWNTGNSETGYGMVTHMTDTGSKMANGEVIPFSQYAQDGKIKAFISLTKEGQSTPIEVMGRLLPNGQVEFIPEPGSIAAQCFDSNGKFIGRFFEIVADRGVDADGIRHIIPLATEVGKGLDGRMFTDTVQKTVSDLVTKTTVLGFNRVTNLESAVAAVPGIIPIPIYRRKNLTNGPQGETPSGGAGNPERRPAEPGGGGRTPPNETGNNRQGGGGRTPPNETGTPPRRGPEAAGGGAAKRAKWEAMGDEVGKSKDAVRMLAGEYDILSGGFARQRDALFNRWWHNDLTPEVRNRFRDGSSDPLVPDSVELQRWIKNNGGGMENESAGGTGDGGQTPPNETGTPSQGEPEAGTEGTEASAESLLEAQRQADRETRQIFEDSTNRLRERMAGNQAETQEAGENSRRRMMDLLGGAPDGAGGPDGRPAEPGGDDQVSPNETGAQSQGEDEAGGDDNRARWEPMRSQVGDTDTAIGILSGEYDGLGEAVRNVFFEDWWNDLAPEMQGKLYRKELVPDSIPLQTWIAEHGATTGLEDKGGAESKGEEPFERQAAIRELQGLMNYLPKEEQIQISEIEAGGGRKILRAQGENSSDIMNGDLQALLEKARAGAVQPAA